LCKILHWITACAGMAGLLGGTRNLAALSTLITDFYFSLRLGASVFYNSDKPRLFQMASAGAERFSV
jgi:hypothetical protein